MIDITITSVIHNFFLVLQQGLDIYLYFFFFQFYSVVRRDGKVHYSAGSSFFFTITMFDRLAAIRWYVSVSKS